MSTLATRLARGEREFTAAENTPCAAIQSLCIYTPLKRVTWLNTAGLALGLALILSPFETKADGLVVRTKQTQGPFIVTIFTPPEASRDLPTEVMVMIQRRDSGEVVMDAEVDLSFVPPVGANLSPTELLCGPTDTLTPTLSRTREREKRGNSAIRAPRAQAANKLFYGTPLVFRAAGNWQLQATIRKGGEAASVNCRLPIGMPPHRLRGLWPYLAVPPVAIALFVLNQWLRRRTAKSLSEKSVLGSTGYQPVPSGDSPDGMGRATDTNASAPLVSMTTVVPAGGSPTGVGGSPALPVFQKGSHAVRVGFEQG